MEDNITRKEAISLAVDEGNDAYKRGVIAGRKEVCDWIKGENKFSRQIGYYAITYSELQDKFKEWGIA